MADTVFRVILPLLKAVDNGDRTYSLSVEAVLGGGIDTVFKNTSPPLKAVNLGDGTYAIDTTFI